MNLKISKTKREQIRSININHALGGSESTYIQLTLNTGAKLFSNQIERNYSYEGQKYAYANGFGPNLGDKFMIKLSDKKYYCYVTQHALPAGSHKLRYTDDNLKDDLINLMHDHGWSTEDYEDPDGDRNLGFIKEKMVCIDFGAMSRGEFI